MLKLVERHSITEAVYDALGSKPPYKPSDIHNSSRGYGIKSILAMTNASKPQTCVFLEPAVVVGQA